MGGGGGRKCRKFDDSFEICFNSFCVKSVLWILIELLCEGAAL